MNTEDSEFKRLEHEALLRASQPERQVQPVPLAAHQASYHPALYRNYPTDVLDALHDAFMALPPCPLFGVIGNALQEIESLRQMTPVQPASQSELQEAFAQGMSCRPSSVQRQPLTMAKIKNMDCRVEFDEHLRVVRMTEAVHGIGA